MAFNLRDRLRHIRQETKVTAQSGKKITLEGWSDAGYMTLKREIVYEEDFIFPETIPDSSVFLIKGINPCMAYEDMVFFDLETTGLSTGPGTIAFLAAFGRLHPSELHSSGRAFALHITQYLLLDYPGESDFIEALLAEIKPNSIIVSYNGKCFDSQILKTRCIMKGIMPPDFCHLDLLYPARTLWKKLLESCSQSVIEIGILGISREGDIPGAFAPEIWFSFLNTGKTEKLLLICDHNKKDIAGLVSIFSAMLKILADPAGTENKIKFDIESLAIKLCDINLLRYAAEQEYPLAVLQYALASMRNENYCEGRKWLLNAASCDASLCDAASCGGGKDIQIRALRSLAIDSEWRLKDPHEALEFAKKAEGLFEPASSIRKDFERRIERLEKKLLQN